MKKKIVSLFLTVAMCLILCMALGGTASAANAGDLSYEISGGTVTITDYPSGVTGTLEIPSTIDGYPVTTIGSSAFMGCLLTKIVLPDTITTIERSAFYGCTQLTSINIPNGVTTIKNGAFYNCNSLTSLVLPSTVTSIESSAFEKCASLTTFSIPSGVTDIGEEAFEDCTSLTSISIPATVTSIGEGAFQGCSSLASVTIPGSVSTIEERAFSGCEALTNVTLSNGITSIGAQTFYGCSALTSISIPSSVKTLGNQVFYGCTNLANVTFSEGLEEVGSGLFFRCTSLTTISLPSTLTEISSSMFYRCTGLTSIYIPKSIVSIQRTAFSNCDSLTDVYYEGTESDWNNISLYTDNDSLTSATIHYQSSGLPGGSTTNSFTDVNTTHYFYNAVLWAVNNGITSGTTSTTFSPYQEAERCQVVTFLWRAAGCPSVSASVTNPFTDVKTDDYFYTAVLWAVENGITSGTTSTTFSPYDLCERCQVVTFLYRYFGEPAVATSNNPFTDVNTSHYFYKAVLWAVENGITSGTSATTFGPTVTCERCMVVTFLYRSIGE